jgi:hypothetical protein
LLHRGPLRTAHARSRAHGPSKPLGRFSTALKILRRIRRASIGGPPVRSPRCSTCPSVPASAPASLQRLTCPRQRPCGHEHQARYPASYTGTFREETRPCGARFPAAFQPPAFASWAPCPARGFRPSYDRPTARLRIPAPARRTLARFTRSARVRPGPGRALSVPRGQRCPLAIVESVAAACRLSTAGPWHPGTTTQPGMCK